MVTDIVEDSFGAEDVVEDSVGAGDDGITCGACEMIQQVEELAVEDAADQFVDDLPDTLADEDRAAVERDNYRDVMGYKEVEVESYYDPCEDTSKEGIKVRGVTFEDDVTDPDGVTRDENVAVVPPDPNEDLDAKLRLLMRAGDEEEPKEEIKKERKPKVKKDTQKARPRNSRNVKRKLK